mgnify:CR=1 FL=1
MTTKPEQVLEQLRSGEYKPLYFLQGDEPYFIDAISNYIESNALEESEKGFNQMIMYGKDSRVDEILTNARRFPMMANRQVIIVKEAQEIQHLGRQDAQKLLQDYVENPQPATVLVFCHKHKTLDGRKALTKSIIKHATFVDCKKLYDNKIPGWVHDYVKSKGATIDQGTAQLLSDYIGNNLERVSTEIDKILINLKSPAKIDADAVQKYVGISKDYNVFELQKALVVKDKVKAQKIVQYFASNPKLNPVIPIIAVLFSFFSKLLLVQHSGTHSEQDLAKALRIRPFMVREYLVATRNYTLVQVINNIGHLRTADLQVKGVGNQYNSDGEVLKELIFKLTH